MGLDVYLETKVVDDQIERFLPIVPLLNASEYDITRGFQMLNGGIKKFIEGNMRKCLEIKE